MTVPGKRCPGKASLAKLLFRRWPVGQGQLYGWEGRTAWLPRVTERECTNGLPRESTIDTGGWAGFASLSKDSENLVQRLYGKGLRGRIAFQCRLWEVLDEGNYDYDLDSNHTDGRGG